MLSFVTIPVISLNQDNFFCNIDDLVSRHKTNHICYPRIRLFLAMGHTHPPSYRNIEPFKSIIARNCYEGEVVGIYVDIIIGWHRNCDLEFPGQVVPSVNGLFLMHARLHLFSIEPYFMIGTGSRGKVIAELF